MYILEFKIILDVTRIRNLKKKERRNEEKNRL